MINFVKKLVSIFMSKPKINKEIFFDEYRKAFGKLSQNRVNSIEVFLMETDRHLDYFTVPEWAYVYATTFHETNATFEPVIEAYWLSDDWRKKNLRYYPYFGRGFVQLTWKENYEKYSKLLNVDMVETPDLALVFTNSFFILTHGMKEGTFTGKKLSDYIRDGRTDYLNARRIINGTDKASLIKGYADTFEKIFNKSIA